MDIHDPSCERSAWAHQLIEDYQEPVQYHYIGAQLHQGVMQASLEIALAGHVLGRTPWVPTVGGRHAEQEVVQGLALHLQVCRIEPLLPGTIGETVVPDFFLVARQPRIVVIDHADQLVCLSQRRLVQSLDERLQHRLHVALFALVGDILTGLVRCSIAQRPDVGEFPFLHMVHSWEWIGVVHGNTHRVRGTRRDFERPGCMLSMRATNDPRPNLSATAGRARAT